MGTSLHPAVRTILVLTICVLAYPAQTVSGPDWPAGTMHDAGISAEKLRAMEAAVRAGEFQKIGSILIARRGRLIYEHYFDGDASTLRDTRAATKSIADVLIGVAIAEHKLKGFDARVLALLPKHARKLKNPDPRKTAITVEDLLTMSSPLECDDWNEFSRGNEERMYLIEDWAQFFFDLPIRGRMRVGEQKHATPGTRDFSYCTAGVFVLSEVIEAATNMRTDRYARQKLFDPLRIAKAEWVYSPMDVPQTGGGLRLTSRDILKIAQLYLNGGRWHDQQIIPASWVEASTRAYARIDGTTEYGYLWWLKSFRSGPESHAAFFMSGNGGNKVVGFPSLDLAVAITSTNYNTRGMHEQTEKLLSDYILAAVEHR